MQVVQPIKALYYPRIQFASVGWLRAALLYWEGVLRILPEGFAPWDPPEVHELATLGLIEDLSPAPYRRRAAERFVAILERQFRKPGGWSPESSEEPSTLVHVDMMEQGLLRELQARGLAAVAREWATMPAEIAKLYEMALANEAGQELHAAPATDESDDDIPRTYFAHQVLSADPATIAPIDGFASVRRIDPFPRFEDGPPLPTERLCSLRERYSKQRRAFREKIQVRTTAVATLPSPDAIRSHLRDLTSEIRAETERERVADKASRVADAWRLARITAPAAIGAAVSFAGAPALVAAVGVVGSMGVGFADWLLQWRQRRRADAQYLFLLERSGGRRRENS